MSAETFEKVKKLKAEVDAAQPDSLEALEQFRIQYLGSKNVIKPLFGEIRNIANEQKKEYGQLVNSVKEAAEAKYEALKARLEAAAEQAAVLDIDLTAPGEPLELGARHPVAITLNRIVRIFERIGFV
ncbi:MAG: phenylalanine--tRNA ligase subunit alpha, partial [Phaeodactylibacter sp.]|nr:phenylalanine--tRNA ligase subunit alpha [Phaeodactylibacter sp.]